MNIIKSTCRCPQMIKKNFSKDAILSIFTASPCVNVFAIFKLNSANTVSFTQANFRKVPISWANNRNFLLLNQQSDTGCVYQAVNRTPNVSC